MMDIPAVPTPISCEDLARPEARELFLRLCLQVDLLQCGSRNCKEKLIEEIKQSFRKHPGICRVVDCNGFSLLWLCMDKGYFLWYHDDRPGNRPDQSWHELIKWIITRNPYALLWLEGGHLSRSPIEKLLDREIYDSDLLLWIIERYPWVFAGRKERNKGDDPLHFRLLKQCMTGKLLPIQDEDYLMTSRQISLSFLPIQHLYSKIPVFLFDFSAKQRTVFHEILRHHPSEYEIFCRYDLFRDDAARTFRFMASKCPPEILSITDGEGKTALHYVCGIIRKLARMGTCEARPLCEIAHFLIVRCPQAILMEDLQNQTPLDSLIGLTSHSTTSTLILTVARSLATAMLKQLYVGDVAKYFQTMDSNVGQGVAQWLFPRIQSMASQLGSKPFLWEIHTTLRKQYDLQQEYQLMEYMSDNSLSNNPRQLVVEDAYSSWAKTRLMSMKKAYTARSLENFLILEALKRERSYIILGRRLDWNLALEMKDLDRPFSWDASYT